MNKIWNFAPWLPSKINGNDLVEHCAILNIEDVVRGGPSPREFSYGSYPIAQLKLTLTSFDVDCFLWEGFMLVSKQMRHAMALVETHIEYFEVDSSQCAALPQSKNYQIMNVPVTEEISDISKSNYQMRRLLPDLPSTPFMVHSIAVRPDIELEYQLFYDKFFRGYMFCTDELAVRVLRAGCTGVRFFDTTRMSLITPKRFRTLRGVEEWGEWDPVKMVEHTVLVEEIR